MSFDLDDDDFADFQQASNIPSYNSDLIGGFSRNAVPNMDIGSSASHSSAPLFVSPAASSMSSRSTASGVVKLTMDAFNSFTSLPAIPDLSSTMNIFADVPKVSSHSRHDTLDDEIVFSISGIVGAIDTHLVPVVEAISIATQQHAAALDRDYLDLCRKRIICVEEFVTRGLILLDSLPKSPQTSQLRKSEVRRVTQVADNASLLKAVILSSLDASKYSAARSSSSITSDLFNFSQPSLSATEDEFGGFESAPNVSERVDDIFSLKAESLDPFAPLKTTDEKAANAILPTPHLMSQSQPHQTNTGYPVGTPNFPVVSTSIFSAPTPSFNVTSTSPFPVLPSVNPSTSTLAAEEDEFSDFVVAAPPSKPIQLISLDDALNSLIPATNMDASLPQLGRVEPPNPMEGLNSKPLPSSSWNVLPSTVVVPSPGVTGSTSFADDDFGDFSSGTPALAGASDTNHPTPSVSEGAAFTSNLMISKDEFGDFQQPSVGASIPDLFVSPALPPALPATPDTDPFGSMISISNELIPKITEMAQLQAPPENDTTDEFGDFSTATVQPAAFQNTMEPMFGTGSLPSFTEGPVSVNISSIHSLFPEEVREEMISSRKKLEVDSLFDISAPIPSKDTPSVDIFSGTAVPTSSQTQRITSFFPSTFDGDESGPPPPPAYENEEEAAYTAALHEEKQLEVEKEYLEEQRELETLFASAQPTSVAPLSASSTLFGLTDAAAALVSDTLIDNSNQISTLFGGVNEAHDANVEVVTQQSLPDVTPPSASFATVVPSTSSQLDSLSSVSKSFGFETASTTFPSTQPLHDLPHMSEPISSLFPSSSFSAFDAPLPSMGAPVEELRPFELRSTGVVLTPLPTLSTLTSQELHSPPTIPTVYSVNPESTSFNSSVLSENLSSIRGMFGLPTDEDSSSNPISAHLFAPDPQNNQEDYVQPAEISQASTVTETTVESDIVDDFGDFDGPLVASSSITSTNAPITEPPSVRLESPHVGMENIASDKEFPHFEEGDDFGDFSEVGIPIPNPSIEMEASAEESAPVQASQNQNEQPVVNLGVDKAEDEDFGDFDAAPVSFESFAGIAVPPEPAGTSVDRKTTAIERVEFDEFGDFTDASFAPPMMSPLEVESLSAIESSEVHLVTSEAAIQPAPHTSPVVDNNSNELESTESDVVVPSVSFDSLVDRPKSAGVPIPAAVQHVRAEDEEFLEELEELVGSFEGSSGLPTATSSVKVPVGISSKDAVSDDADPLSEIADLESVLSHLLEEGMSIPSTTKSITSATSLSFQSPTQMSREAPISSELESPAALSSPGFHPVENRIAMTEDVSTGFEDDNSGRNGGQAVSESEISLVSGNSEPITASSGGSAPEKPLSSSLEPKQHLDELERNSLLSPLSRFAALSSPFSRATSLDSFSPSFVNRLQPFDFIVTVQEPKNASSLPQGSEKSLSTSSQFELLRFGILQALEQLFMNAKSGKKFPITFFHSNPEMALVAKSLLSSEFESLSFLNVYQSLSMTEVWAKFTIEEANKRKLTAIADDDLESALKYKNTYNVARAALSDSEKTMTLISQLFDDFQLSTADLANVGVFLERKLFHFIRQVVEDIDLRNGGHASRNNILDAASTVTAVLFISRSSIESTEIDSGREETFRCADSLKLAVRRLQKRLTELQSDSQVHASTLLSSKLLQSQQLTSYCKKLSTDLSLYSRLFKVSASIVHTFDFEQASTSFQQLHTAASEILRIVSSIPCESASLLQSVPAFLELNDAVAQTTLHSHDIFEVLLPEITLLSTQVFAFLTPFYVV